MKWEVVDGYLVFVDSEGEEVSIPLQDLDELKRIIDEAKKLRI